jgi:hypothetical protein
VLKSFPKGREASSLILTMRKEKSRETKFVLVVDEWRAAGVGGL